MNCLARVAPNLLPGKFGMIDAFRLRVDDGVVEEPIKEARMANFGFFNKVAAKAREKIPGELCCNSQTYTYSIDAVL
ncbi:MAG: hypothetical protein WB870_14405 [Gallionellaceae bacterium]|jgi:hypothetical protein